MGELLNDFELLQEFFRFLFRFSVLRYFSFGLFALTSLGSISCLADDLLESSPI